MHSGPDEYDLKSKHKMVFSRYCSNGLYVSPDRGALLFAVKSAHEERHKGGQLSIIVGEGWSQRRYQSQSALADCGACVLQQ